MLNSMIYGAQMACDDAIIRIKNIFGKDNLPKNLKELSDEKTLNYEDAKKLLVYLSQSLFHFSQQEVIYSTDEVKELGHHKYNDVNYWILDNEKKAGSKINFKAFFIENSLAKLARRTRENGTYDTAHKDYIYYLFSEPLVRFKPFNFFTAIDKNAYEVQYGLEIYPIPYSFPLNEIGECQRETLKYMIRKMEKRPMKNGLQYLLSENGGSMFGGIKSESKIVLIKDEENKKIIPLKISKIKQK